MTKTGDVITFHIGQPGIQIGKEYWNLLLDEYGIQQDGTIAGTYDFNEIQSLKSYFDETPLSVMSSHNKYQPRAVFIDSEPSLTNVIRKSFPHTLNENNMITGNKESVNYTESLYSAESRIIQEQVQNRVRQYSEKSDKLSTFLFFQGTGGASGGLSGGCFRDLQDEYKHILKINCAVIPDQEPILKPYHNLMTLADMYLYSDIIITVENSALHLICKRLGIIPDVPTYRHFNTIISQTICSATYHSTISDVFSDFRNYKGPNFLIPSYSPLLLPIPISNLIENAWVTAPTDITDFASTYCCPTFKTSLKENIFSVQNLINSLFRSQNAMVSASDDAFSCDKKCRYVFTTMKFRGEFDDDQIKQSLNDKTPIKFSENSKTYEMKYSVQKQPPNVSIDNPYFPSIPRSATMFSTSSVMSEVLTRVCLDFDTLYNKRAFVYRFVGQGAEEGEFLEARENIGTIHNEYELMQLEKGGYLKIKKNIFDDKDEGNDEDEEDPDSDNSSEYFMETE